ncbi:unnamed protein product [Citrullus colocynthis]|uniref:Uncharacterized protein n=1 Tax=Citrullus colocynthis TaxID=252529 RepID=A0ABP0YX61_9ROSI
MHRADFSRDTSVGFSLPRFAVFVPMVAKSQIISSATISLRPKGGSLRTFLIKELLDQRDSGVQSLWGFSKIKGIWRKKACSKKVEVICLLMLKGYCQLLLL